MIEPKISHVVNFMWEYDNNQLNNKNYGKSDIKRVASFGT